MFVVIKTQVENSQLPESSFTLDLIMQLHIKFHKLALIRGSSYIELPEWLTKKKAVINPKIMIYNALNGHFSQYTSRRD